MKQATELAKAKERLEPYSPRGAAQGSQTGADRATATGIGRDVHT